MNIDDVLKVLIPKSKRKKLKRQVKKEGLIGLFLSYLRAILTKFSAVSKGKKGPVTHHGLFSRQPKRMRHYSPGYPN